MEEQMQKPKKKIAYKSMVYTLIMIAVIGFGIYTYLSQPKAVNPLSVYTYIANNFNSTISNASYAPSVNTGNPLYNMTNVTFPSDGKIYIYSFSIAGSTFQEVEGTVESYVLWNYLTGGKPFPSYNQSFPLSAGFIPAIPAKYMLSNATANVILIASEVPESASSTTNTILAYLKPNLTNEQRYVGSENGDPGVYVVKTIANKTMTCFAYSGIAFVQYNATTSTSVFLGMNVRNLTFGSLLPTPASMNVQLNLLNSCYKIVSRWQGN